jgi:hypothetical protein
MYSIFKIIILSELKLVIISLLLLTVFTGRAGENRNDLKHYTIEAGDILETATKNFSQKESETHYFDFTDENSEMVFPDQETKEKILSIPDTCNASGKEISKSSSGQKPVRESSMNLSSNNKSFNIYIGINTLCY